MNRLHDITDQLKQLLTERGADRCACEASESETREFNLENGSFTLLRTVFSGEASLRAFLGARMGTASGNDLTSEGLAALADSAVATAASSQEDPAYDLAPDQGTRRTERGPLTPDLDALFGRTRELLDAAAASFPLVRVTRCMMKHSLRHSLYVNTNGTELEETAGAYDVFVEFAANDGVNTTSLDYVEFLTADLDEPFMDMGGLRERFQQAQDSLKAAPMEGKFEGTAILTPDCLSAFLWSLVDSFASDQVILDGTSPWLDRVGEKVAHERFTLALTPNDPRILECDTRTDSGFLAEDCTIIERGVLKAHQLSLYAANKTGRPVMRNTGSSFSVLPGDQSLAEIIAGVSKGIIVGYFSGGSPASNGDFSGVAKNSFLIENGRITKPLTETMINGNLAAIFSSVRGISSEIRADGVTLLPWVAVDGVVISGK